MSASTRTTYKSSAGTIAVDSLMKQVLTVANQLLRLPKFGGEIENMTATQGSFRPSTPYSGTTHTGCAAVDLTAYNWRNRLVVLDLLGAIAGHRLPSEGNWPEHLHVMLNGMGCSAASLKGQIKEVMAGGDGLVGSRPDRDKALRSGLWPLAVYNGRTGKLKAVKKTNLRTGPSYDRKVIRSAIVGTQVNAIMEVNVDGKRWFVTDQGEWGYSGKWAKVGIITPKLVPAQVLDLSDWKLTLSVGVKDHPLEVKQPELATYEHPKDFYVRNGLVYFRTPANGYTTSGSSYPRTELREMNPDGSKAEWSNKSGIHRLSGTLLVDALPPVKPEVVLAQAHDDDDDVVMLRFIGIKPSSGPITHGKVYAEFSLGKGQGSEKKILAERVALRSEFSYTITADREGFSVGFLAPGASGWRHQSKFIIRDDCYFKAGMYLQSNTKYDAGYAFGQSGYRALSIQHS